MIVYFYKVTRRQINFVDHIELEIGEIKILDPNPPV